MSLMYKGLDSQNDSQDFKKCEIAAVNIREDLIKRVIKRSINNKSKKQISTSKSPSETNCAQKAKRRLIPWEIRNA